MSNSYIGMTFSIESTTTITTDILCGFIPTISLCYYGKRSYDYLKSYDYEFSHSSSLFGHVLRILVHIAAISLPCISIAFYVSQLQSSDRMGLLSTPFLIFLSLSAVNWMIGFVLYTMEYRRLGQASDFLKKFWAVSLVAQSAGLGINEWLVLFKHELTALEVVHFIFVVAIATLVIHGVIAQAHESEDISPSRLPILYFPYKDIKVRAKSVRPTNLGIEDEHNANSSNLMSKFVNFSQRQRSRTQGEVASECNLTSLAKPLIETPETKSMDSVISMPTEHSESQQTAAKNNSPLFEDIHIQNYINIEKDDKSTIVYLIKYRKDGKEMETRRSYSEFFKLYYKTRRHHPDAVLPLFPEKKNKNESTQTSTLEERKSQFTLLLQKISEERLHTSHLESFLQSDTLHPTTVRRKSKSRHHQPQTHTENASGSQPIFEATDESETGSVIQHDSRTTSLADLDSVLPSEISSQRSQELALHQERPASLEITEESKEISSPVLARIAGENVISDFTSLKVSQELPKNEQNYKVEFVSAWNDQRKGTPATYYEYQIKDQLREKIFATSKRYSDFKVLHSKLKEYAKKNKFSMPIDLPNRGPCGPMVRKTDPALIKYRKAALPKYLQTLLNHKGFRDCGVLFEFLGIN